MCVQEKLAVMSVTDMLSLPESQLMHWATDCGAKQDDAQRLVVAVSHVRQCIGLLLVTLFLNISNHQVECLGSTVRATVQLNE